MESIKVLEDGNVEITKSEVVEHVEVVNVAALEAQIAEWEKAIVEARAKLGKVNVEVAKVEEAAK